MNSSPSRHAQFVLKSFEAEGYWGAWKMSNGGPMNTWLTWHVCMYIT